MSRIWLLGLLLVCGCVIHLKSEDTSKPPVSLNVSYRYPGTQQLDATTGIFRKELTATKWVKTALLLTDEQKRGILAKAQHVHFFGMPNEFPSQAPSKDSQFIHLTSGALDHTVRWVGPVAALATDTFQLQALMIYVDSIVTSTPAYRQLPQ